MTMFPSDGRCWRIGSVGLAMNMHRQSAKHMLALSNANETKKKETTNYNQVQKSRRWLILSWV